MRDWEIMNVPAKKYSTVTPGNNAPFFAVYATVTLRAGAEVSIELNRLGHVLAVKPGNGDGFTLLDGYGKPDEELEDTVERCMDKNITDWGKIKNIIRDSLSDFLWKKMKRNPMILPIIMEV